MTNLTQLQYHRPYRPREIDSFGSNDPGHPLGGRSGFSWIRFSTIMTSRRERRASPSKATPVTLSVTRRQTEKLYHLKPDRHPGACGFLPMKCPGHSPPARGALLLIIDASQGRRGPRLWQTSIWPWSTISRLFRSSTRSTCRPRGHRAGSRGRSKKTSASTRKMPSVFSRQGEGIGIDGIFAMPS